MYHRHVNGFLAASLMIAATAPLPFTAAGCSGDPAAPCAPLVDIGESIATVQATGSLPTPMGGTVADGTYVLTKDEAYPPTVADPQYQRSETIELAAGDMKIIYVTPSAPRGVLGTAHFTTSGTQATIDWYCGGGGVYRQGYTATDTDLVLISPPGSVSTFTKQ